MNSVRCPVCNLANWSTAIVCKRCGNFLQKNGEDFRGAPAVSSNQPTQSTKNSSQYHQWSDLNESQESPKASASDSYQSQNQPQQVRQFQKQNYYQPYAPANLKSGLAIASMVLGILGIATSILLIGVLIAPVGLILGIVALVKANRYPQTYGGKGFAIAGIVTSSTIVLLIPMIAAIAIPNLLAARRAANEGSAVSTLRMLSAAESVYMNSTEGKCGDVKTLIATKLIDVSLAESEKNGYRFLVVNLPFGGCEVLATPISASGGMRSFYYSTEDGIIRGGAKKGAPADKNDFPLNGETTKLPNEKFRVEKPNSF